jgi:hypothetical protein
MVVLWTVLACSGPSPETLIDELRVVAVVAEPPEIGAMESTSLEVYVADPKEKGVELVVWACTNFGDGCLESTGGSQSFATAIPEGGRAIVDLAPSPALKAFTQAGESLEATVIWALACEPGKCPLVDEVAAVESSSPWAGDLADDLSSPMDWLSDLPQSGVSLAYRLITVSGVPPNERHQNPTITPLFEDLPELKNGKRFELGFEVAGDLGDEARVFNYISGGGFKMTDTLVGEPGEVNLVGFAPKKSGPVDLWVVFNDGLGGVAVWTAQGTVK